MAKLPDGSRGENAKVDMDAFLMAANALILRTSQRLGAMHLS